MRVEHTLTVVCQCPVDGTRNVYTAVVRAGRIVKVEDILAAFAEATKEPSFQEDITQRTAKALGCEVETMGTHSEVRTRVVCGSCEAAL